MQFWWPLVYFYFSVKVKTKTFKNFFQTGELIYTGVKINIKMHRLEENTGLAVSQFGIFIYLSFHFQGNNKFYFKEFEY